MTAARAMTPAAVAMSVDSEKSVLLSCKTVWQAGNNRGTRTIIFLSWQWKKNRWPIYISNIHRIGGGTRR